MQLAKVLGQVVSTVKAPGLDSFTLLLVQEATDADPEHAQGPVYVAVDLVGAGVGEVVLVVKGSAARVAEASAQAPTDAAVVGIADSVIQTGAVTYRKT